MYLSSSSPPSPPARTLIPAMHLVQRSTSLVLPDQPMSQSPTRSSHDHGPAPTPTTAGSLSVNDSSVIAPWLGQPDEPVRGPCAAPSPAC